MNNPELQRAWQIIENTGTHLFLTGKAGTGKTTFLHNLKKESPKRTVIVAPTGIAAINAEALPSTPFSNCHLHLSSPIPRSIPNKNISGSAKKKLTSSEAWIC